MVESMRATLGVALQHQATLLEHHRLKNPHILDTSPTSQIPGVEGENHRDGTQFSNDVVSHKDKMVYDTTLFAVDGAKMIDLALFCVQVAGQELKQDNVMS